MRRLAMAALLLMLMPIALAGDGNWVSQTINQGASYNTAGDGGAVVQNSMTAAGTMEDDNGVFQWGLEQIADGNTFLGESSLVQNEYFISMIDGEGNYVCQEISQVAEDNYLNFGALSQSALITSTIDGTGNALNQEIEQSACANEITDFGALEQAAALINAINVEFLDVLSPEKVIIDP